ncbi:polysaccharide deacetylase family protein [Dehalobacter sp. TBBPA1]|uniref:polysaccharide deacetylase family protein n=1 Tax=Dehalobacter sp. TBBPA1 TaxID=3235037 RepID=UPI0034A590F7
MDIINPTSTASTAEVDVNKIINQVYAVPNDYLRKKGVVLDNFQDTSGWAATSCTKADNTNQYKIGTKSLQLTATTYNTQFYIDKVINWDLSDMESLSFWVYISSNSAFTEDLVVMLSNDSGFSNYYQLTTSIYYYGQAGGWALLTVKKEDAEIGWGEPSWDTVFTKLRIRNKTSASAYAVVSLGGIIKNIESIGRVIICSDDSNESVYTKMFPYLQSKGKNFTFYYITERYNQEGLITPAQLQEIYDAGNDIANHTVNHYDLTSLTEVAARNELTKARQQLNDWGFTRASDHVAYPYGYYSSTVLKVMEENGFKTGRLAMFRNQSMPIDNPYLMRSCSYVYGDTTIADFIAKADEAKEYGWTMIALFHNVTDSPTETEDVPTSDFQSFVDHCISIDLPIVSMSQWYNELNPSSDIPIANTKASADVSIAVANTWYSGASITLAPGRWLVFGQIALLRNTTTALTYSARISDGTNHYASGGDYRTSVANNITTIPLNTVITLTATTTISIQATADQTATIKAALATNGAGNNATQISAVKLA